MSRGTKIEWTDETWNPVTGCTKVSQGCKHCYAEREWPRLQKLVPAYADRDFTSVMTHLDRLDKPLHWKRPRKVFVNSMSDLFHPDVPLVFIARVFAIMGVCYQHTFQILTKRADRMATLLDLPEFRANVHLERLRIINGDAVADAWRPDGNENRDWPLRNVWLGVSVENQNAADERQAPMEQLAELGWMTWVSYEPALGPVDWAPWMSFLSWAVCGGESGPDARPMHPELARSLRDQCAAAGVPFLHKQNGEWGSGYERGDGTMVFREFDTFQRWVNKASTWVNGGICLDRHGRELKNGGDFKRADDEGAFPVTIMHRIGKKASGRLLDGVLHDGYPGSAS